MGSGQGHTISKLALSRTTPVSDIVLHTIAEVFPRLFSFAALHKDVEVFVVLDLIVSGKLNANRVKVCSTNMIHLVDELDERAINHKLMEDVLYLSL